MDAKVSTVLYIISVPFSEETLFINDQLFNFQFIIKEMVLAYFSSGL